MRMFYRFCAILLFVFLSSCSAEKESELETLFNDGQYQKVTERTSEILSETLDEESLYFRTLSEYRLGNSSSARDGSLFYLLAFDNDAPHYYDLAEILLRTSKGREALFAGNILYDSGHLSRIDYLPYYSALVSSDNMEMADDFFEAISPTLSEYDKTFFTISAERDSDRIVTSLESLYAFSGLDNSFISMMEKAIPLLIKRGDAAMLLNLISYGSGDSPEYSLYIGDVYFALGDMKEASAYWLKAMEAYPVQSDIRLRSL